MNDSMDSKKALANNPMNTPPKHECQDPSEERHGRHTFSDEDLLSQGFMRGFVVGLCDEGWRMGWHERNGGNASYRLRPEEEEAAKPFFRETPGDWVPMDVTAENLANEHFVCTGAGRYMRNIAENPAKHTGIVELNGEGDAYRIVWGFEDGAVPTSEFASHVLNHSVRKTATDGACRVMYHAHPTNIIALSFVLPLDSRTFTRTLWKAMTECVLVFPQGIGVVPCMVPGKSDLAKASSKLLRTFDAAVWAHHGLFVSGPDFDAAFGLMHCVEKAADIYRCARTMNGGSDDFLNTISDDILRAIAREFDLPINEAFLEDDSLI